MAPGIRWGIVGTAGIANPVIEQGIRPADGQVVAIGSRNLAKAQEFAKKHSIPQAYGSYEEVISDADVDAVYIALPACWHEEITIKAAQHKKHVLCEKPVAENRAIVAKMIEACIEEGVVFVDGTWFAHHPRTAFIRNLLHPKEDGATSKIGRVRNVMARFTFSSPDMGADNIRVQPDVEPLAALGDIGWYTVRTSLIAYDFELPEKAVAVTTATHPVTGAVTQLSGTLIYSQGRSATFDISFNSAFDQSATITGELGLIRIPDCYHPYAGRASEGKETFSKVFLQNGGDGTKLEEIGVEVDKNQCEYYIRGFHECVAGEKDWKVLARESYAIHAVLDAVWASAHNDSKPVAVVAEHSF
ncbi:hypothetical protein BJ742DRAFT_830853 [Cladochytrium replicatum]|nr:hypothetical protein BJ742DRAFT_830853 [Cladochytrium replicatum]